MQTLRITKRDILENFDNATYSRGFEYYRYNRVLKYDIYDSGHDRMLVHARVQGSRQYTQKIEIRKHGGDVVIDADCSCPVGHHCKHTVAVLFQMLRSGMREAHRDEAAVWMNKLLAVQKQKRLGAASEQEYFLLFRLFESMYDDFEFYKGKILKNGSLSKGTKISKENLLHYRHHEWKYPFVTEEDNKLIGYLANTKVSSYANRFKREYGAFILKKLCETGRCFFRKNDQPLRFDSRVEPLTFE